MGRDRRRDDVLVQENPGVGIDELADERHEALERLRRRLLVKQDDAVENLGEVACRPALPRRHPLSDLARGRDVAAIHGNEPEVEPREAREPVIGERRNEPGEVRLEHRATGSIGAHEPLLQRTKGFLCRAALRERRRRCRIRRGSPTARRKSTQEYPHRRKAR